MCMVVCRVNAKQMLHVTCCVFLDICLLFTGCNKFQGMNVVYEALSGCTESKRKRDRAMEKNIFQKNIVSDLMFKSRKKSCSANLKQNSD